MHPKELSILDYTYDLPNERIAKYPLTERDQSKLLIYQDRSISESIYYELDEHLPEDCFLVFNKTKVVEARLLFKKSTGGVIEVFCLEPDKKYPDITIAMLQKKKVLWKCLIGGASKWKHGMVLQKNINDVLLEASIIDRDGETFTIELRWNTELSFAEVLHKAGDIPLPPYLHRDIEENDKERYQTIYAKEEGSVAAPTAGLHFTERLFEKLRKKNIESAFVTLHVGAGTFKPVKAEKMVGHEMHAEFIDAELNFIEQLIKYLDKTIVAVGTTSLRTVESLYWIGCKIQKSRVKSQNVAGFSLHQWDPYEMASELSAKEAFQVLVNWMKEQNMQRLITKTQIIIAPGYELKVAKGLVTNFHQPQSTLLLLVAAVVGEDWREVYDYAMKNDFRFLSYGDGCLLWSKKAE
jgi:S-adenosylmethionine:tRNA ribosyltransferase-isomerase